MTASRFSLLACLCCCLASCASSGPPVPGPESGPMVLDDRESGARGGRRVVLSPDGSFQQSVFSEVRIGEASRETAGSYRISEDRKSLTLIAPSGSTQTLYRVPFGGHIYWVKFGEQERAGKEGEDYLRKTSLRVVPANAGTMRSDPPLRGDGS